MVRAGGGLNGHAGSRRQGRQGERRHARLVKGREEVLACRTKRELLATVAKLQQLAFMRGYTSGRRKGMAEALGEAPETMWRKRGRP